VVCVAGKGNVYNIFDGKPEEKRPLGRCRLRQEDNNKVGLKRNRL
jgi:hypothetical protein